MEKIVGVKAADKPAITKEEVDALYAEAVKAINSITSVPTLTDMYKAVDDLWDSGKTKQLIFKNRDQHYAYVTELYNSQIKNISLEDYKRMLIAQTQNRFDALYGIIDHKKMAEAYKLHNEHKQKVLKSMQDQIDDLRKRNEEINKGLLEEIRDK